jgi:hypothetical protein
MVAGFCGLQAHGSGITLTDFWNYAIPVTLRAVAPCGSKRNWTAEAVEASHLDGGGTIQKQDEGEMP